MTNDDPRPLPHSSEVGQHQPTPIHTAASPLEWVQAFGAVAAVTIALVTTDTPTTRITVGLAVCVAALVCLVLRHALTDQPWTPRRRAVFTGQVAVSILLAAATVIVSIVAGGGQGRTADRRAAAIDSAADAPTPVMTRAGYTLAPSAFIDTNDQDKLDLDTGCPGWGNMHPRLGPSRCGELADIIVDGEGVHTPDDSARFAIPAAGSPGTYQTCRDWLDRKPNQNVNQIDAEQLAPQTTICVETDKQNIALIHVERISLDPSRQLTAITIGFILWNQD